VKSTLIDAGPLIALFSPRDKYHAVTLSFLENYQGELVTTWPVITEAHHMLDFDRRAQVALLEWLNRGAVGIYEIHAHEIQDLIELTEKYNDLPMDLADATLVQAANQLHLQQIITIDSDFNVYRTAKNRMLQNIFKEGRRGKA